MCPNHLLKLLIYLLYREHEHTLLLGCMLVHCQLGISKSPGIDRGSEVLLNMSFHICNGVHLGGTYLSQQLEDEFLKERYRLLLNLLPRVNLLLDLQGLQWGQIYSSRTINFQKKNIEPDIMQNTILLVACCVRRPMCVSVCVCVCLLCVRYIPS